MEFPPTLSPDFEVNNGMDYAELIKITIKKSLQVKLL